MSQSIFYESKPCGVKTFTNTKELFSSPAYDLSWPDQILLKDFLLLLAKQEFQIEKLRQKLALHSEFEPYQAFKRITTRQYTSITSIQLLEFLRSNNSENVSEADSAYFIKYFDSDFDGQINYEDFL